LIAVTPQPEPSLFDKRVRQPGQRFLKLSPKPKSWTRRDYWRRSIKELHTAYRGICAYSAHWIPSDTGCSTVDHYVPKDLAPELSYEWANYRLASLKLNGFKGNFLDVLDPFTLGKDWFVLGFPSLLVKPNPDLSDDKAQGVWATIRRLKLNEDEPCVNARLQWLLNYCDGHIDLVYLKRNAPFIAYELERQGLVNTIAVMMQS